MDDTDPALGNVGPGFGQGFNGENDPPVFAPQTCDLSAYAGEDVGLAFRVFNDGGLHFDGFWVDNVAIDGVQVPDGDGASLDAWQSATEFNPVEVEGYTVQLVAYDSAGGGDAHLFSIPVDGDVPRFAERDRRGRRASGPPPTWWRRSSPTTTARSWSRSTRRTRST